MIGVWAEMKNGDKGESKGEEEVRNGDKGEGN